jgi:hypothetical protein
MRHLGPPALGPAFSFGVLAHISVIRDRDLVLGASRASAVVSAPHAPLRQTGKFMHTMLVWEVTAGEARRKQIDEALRAKLRGYSWVRPLGSVYVVKVQSAEERDELRKALVEVIKANAEKIHLIVSPLMEGGRYGGFLPKALWEKLNLRTKP